MSKEKCESCIDKDIELKEQAALFTERNKYRKIELEENTRFANENHKLRMHFIASRGMEQLMNYIIKKKKSLEDAGLEEIYHAAKDTRDLYREDRWKGRKT